MFLIKNRLNDRGGLWSADDGNFHQVDLEEAWKQHQQGVSVKVPRKL